MPISTISQTISTIPEAGHRGVDVQTTFVNKQEDFQDHLQGTTVAELNALKNQINTTVSGMNAAVTNVNTKASEADADALSASNSAGVATTKAAEANASAISAAASAASLTPSGILTSIKTVDGTGSGLDADLLDGLDSTEFMRKSVNNTITQNIIFNNGGTDTNGISFASNNGNDINIDMYNGDLRFFRNNGVSPFGIASDNNLYSNNGRLLTSNTPIGYTSGLGVGGLVTQATSKSTSVTLNKLTGQITMSNSSLVGGSTVGFYVGNSNVGYYDTVLVNFANMNDGIDYANYNCWAVPQNGGFWIVLKNISTYNLAQAVRINFTVLKGAIS